MKEISMMLDEDVAMAFSRLNVKAQKSIIRGLKKNLEILTDNLSSCESPIEEMFGSELFLGRELMLSAFESLDINSQQIIKSNDKNYRVDFSINSKLRGVSSKFVIECDGHDFHEKTKEQVSRDKLRDRDLMRCGYTVIRFSGSEINKNARHCVKEVFEIINSVTKGR